MDDSGDGLLSEEEMSEWLMDESHLTLNSAFEMGKCLYDLSLRVVDSAVPVRVERNPNKITQHSKNESVSMKYFYKCIQWYTNYAKVYKGISVYASKQSHTNMQQPIHLYSC